MKALVVPSDLSSPLKVVDIAGDLASIQEIVKGYIECVPIDSSYQSKNGGVAVHGYINEEGKLISLPLNERATTLVYGHMIWISVRLPVLSGDVIVGEMVILGNCEADEAAVPEDVIEYIKNQDLTDILK